jgi:hypothetical protein
VRRAVDPSSQAGMLNSPAWSSSDPVVSATGPIERYR